MGAFEIIDEVFLRDADTELLARRYQPAGPGPFPFVLHVHGGVWNNGSRASDAAICGHFAGAGIGVLSIDFRQAPRHRYPRSIADIHYGLRWLKAHAEQFGSRPEWVGGVGVSSGGHQLLLATLRPDNRHYAWLHSADVAGVDATVPYLVLCWPVTDPLERYRWAVREGRDQLVVLHDAYWTGPTTMAHGNPQRIVEALGASRASPMAPVLPRAMLVYGTADDNIPVSITDAFIAAYREAGGDLEVARFEGMAHGFVQHDPQTPQAQRALAMMTAFVRRGRIPDK